MVFRASTLFVCLLLASAAAAETVYKYRLADGQMLYSNRRIPGAELIEAFEYRFPAPAAARSAAPKAAAEAAATAAADGRMKIHLAALDKAWSEVQNASRALADAEARLSAGATPFEEETVALAGPAKSVTPAVGGPQALVAPAAGGPPPATLPAVGGPMGTRRGGGRNADYHDRVAVFETDVKAARARLDTALRNYNQLR